MAHKAKQKFLSTSRDLPDSVSKLFKLVHEELHDCNGVLVRRLPNSSIIVKAEDVAAAADKPMEIEGIANLAETDRWGEVIKPSAWEKYLKAYMQNPMILRDHRRDCPIGSATTVEIKTNGLMYKAVIGVPTPYGLTHVQVETRSLLAQKVLRCNSVGFIPHIMEWDDDLEILTHIESELLEISVVPIPMQQSSYITSVKSLRRIEAMGEKTKEEGTDETKTMLKECVDGIKNIATGVQTLVDAYTKDNTKMLADLSEKDAKIKSMGEELEKIKAGTEELLKNLEAAGVSAEEA